MTPGPFSFALHAVAVGKQAADIKGLIMYSVVR
jgi:hypothetical protein